MRKTNNLVLAVPLGALLLVVASLALDPPGAAKRPAPSFSMLVNGRHIHVKEKLDPERTIEVRRAIASIDDEPVRVDFLETVILQGAVGDKKVAIHELGQIGDSGAVAALSVALTDDDQRVRKAAGEALARIGGDDALAAIASASRDADPRERARAAEALALAGGYSAVDYLELALHDEDARVRATAIESLGDLGDSRAINIISAALRDPDPDVRERAANLLDQLNDDALFHVLYPAQ